MQKLAEKLFTRYTNLAIGSAHLVVIITTSFSVFLTVFSIYRHYQVVDFDPTKGFETRGTTLSDGRITLESLKLHQLSNEKILRWYFSQSSISSKNSKKVGKKSIRSVPLNTTLPPSSTLEPITVNYDEYGVDSEPNSDDLNDYCEMFGAIGKSIPYEVIEYLGKIMVEVSSYEKLFTIPVLKHLCDIDKIIEENIKLYNFTNQASNLKHSFNIPFYTTCHNITTANTCESINDNDVDQFRQLIEKCRKNSTLEMCDAFAINQVINWLLPRGETPKRPFVITVVLRVTAYNGKNRIFYESLITKLEEHLEKDPNLKLSGIFLNMKDAVFQDNIYRDIMIAGISATLVSCCFLIYSGSIVFTVIILAVVALSSGVAFFIYTVIFGIDFFPFVNFLVIIILISIGADDAFLLLVHFRKEIEIISNLKFDIGSTYIPIYHKKDLLIRSLRVSLHHSLISMFVTSLTTAITFLTNVISPIIVLRCFGIYASLTVAVNYILVLLILPGALIITRPTTSFHCFFPLSDFIGRLKFSLKLAVFTQKFRYLIVLFTILLSAFSIAILMVMDPGLTVPKHNPTKLLVDSNIHEFYDNNIHQFNFEWKRSQRVVKNFLIGIEPTKQKNSLSPYQLAEPRNFSKSSNYQMNIGKLQTYKEVMDSEVLKSHLKYKYNSWVDGILKNNDSCLYEKKISSFCLMSLSAKTQNLIHQFPDSQAVTPGDGPFIDENMNIVGYFMTIPTSEKLRIDVDMFDRIFEEIGTSCANLKSTKKSKNDPLICSSSSEITKFYDVVDQLKSSNSTSVLISMITCLVVLLIITRKIKLSIISAVVILAIIIWTITILYLSGWHLSVVESTILIITIGLSFDYTLHYVVAINTENNQKFGVSNLEKMRLIHSTAGIACLFGAITLVLAGCPLLFTQTSAFFQIGQMLVVLGATSLIGSAIVLPGFVNTFLFRNEITESTKL